MKNIFKVEMKRIFTLLYRTYSSRIPPDFVVYYPYLLWEYFRDRGVY